MGFGKKTKPGFPGFAKETVVLFSPIQSLLPLLKQQYLLHLQSHLYAVLCEFTAAPRYSLGGREDAVHGNISKQDHQRLPILQLTLHTKHNTCFNYNLFIPIYINIYFHLQSKLGESQFSFHLGRGLQSTHNWSKNFPKFQDISKNVSKQSHHRNFKWQNWPWDIIFFSQKIC